MFQNTALRRVIEISILSATRCLAEWAPSACYECKVAEAGEMYFITKCAAHRPPLPHIVAWRSVAVEIDHPEVISFTLFDEYESVSSDAEPAIAELSHELAVGMIQNRREIFYDNEIITRSLIFVK